MTHRPATTPATGQHLADAATHVAAAAELLEAGDSSQEIFSPTRSLATQLQLIGHGLAPGITPATDAFAPVGTATAHVDYALTLLEALDPTSRPADLFLWYSRLADLRSGLTTIHTPRP